MHDMTEDIDRGYHDWEAMLGWTIDAQHRRADTPGWGGVKGWKGKIVAYCDSPTVVIEDEEGNRQSVALSVIGTFRAHPEGVSC